MSPQQYNPDYDAKPVEGPNKKTRLANRVAFLSLGIVGIAVIIFTFWGIQSKEVITVNNSPFPTRIENKTANTDGTIYVKIDECKKYDKVGELRVSFISESREIFLPIDQEKLPKGCSDTEYPIKIPKDIIPDTYSIKFRVTYDINPIKQDVTQIFMTQKFKIDGEMTPPAVPVQ